MIKTRIIPVITVRDSVAVQTVKFSNPRPIGSLQQLIAVYERRQVDEIAVLDLTPGKTPRFRLFEPFLAQLFCPAAVGGSVHSIQAATRLLRMGADKVIIPFDLTKTRLFSDIAKKLGAQSLVAAIDATCVTGARFWAVRAGDAVEAGAGEVLLTSTDKQGTLGGYDLDLIDAVSAAVSVPVIAHGGCGEPAHMLGALKAGAHAVAAGSMFAFTEYTPRECARYLREHGIKVRMD
jgi:imidazoleglycerol phosphate synthase cyclase subunit